MAEVTVTIERYLSSIGNFELLSKEEFIALSKRYNAGDLKAKKVMIRHNLKLVVNLCSKYHQTGQELLDVIQEGNLGLIRAVEKYDFESGFAFSTYATHWIKYFAEKYLSENKKIAYVPLHTMKLSRKIARTIKKADVDGVKWTVASLAKELDVSESKIQAGIALQDADASLNTKVSNESDSSEIGDLLPQMENENFSIETEDRNKMLYKMISDLPDRQKQAIIHFYGLFNTDEKSGAATGKIIGVSRERVRQLIKEAQSSLLLMARKEGIDITSLVL